MADSIYPDNLPSGYDAYLGYSDGSWPTAALLPSKFPGKHVVTLTVRDVNAATDGCDCENGDLTPAHAADFAKNRLAAGARRPVIYASTSQMFAVLDELAARKVARAQVRLLTAHYDARYGRHVCGPSTCKYTQGGRTIPAMDGTQWTDQAPGNRGSKIDASLLEAGFFSGAPSPSAVPVKPPSARQPVPPAPPAGKARVPDCRGLDTLSAHNHLLRYGLTPAYEAGTKWGEVCYETTPGHWSMADPGSKVTILAGKTTPELRLGSGQTPWNTALQVALNRTGLSITVDGSFGPVTDEALRYFQYHSMGAAAEDGICGGNTWNALTAAGKIAPPANPGDWTYPAPAGLGIGQGTATIPVSWKAVAHAGKNAASYTLQILDNKGQVFQAHTVNGTSETVTLPRGTYTARVFADGSPKDSPRTDFKFTV